MNGIDRRIAKLEAPYRSAMVAEQGRLAMDRIRDGTATGEDMHFLIKRGALDYLTPEELEELMEQTTLSLLAEPTCPEDRRAELTGKLEQMKADRAKHAAWLQKMTAGGSSEHLGGESTRSMGEVAK